MTTSTLAQTPASSTAHPIVPRKIQVDWSASPVHWIKDEPFASHLINEIHLLLPAGEFWFCKLFNKALPLITDDKLRADVQAFIRQEAMHARAHEQATEHYLKAHGIDPDDYTRRVEYLFNEGPLADAPFGIRIPERFERDWLVFRLGFVACIEHSTCVLGNYVLDNQVWEDQGDPTVLDMLRWHGAEEVGLL